ncbi:MAG: isoprenylcysteine carboxylmethyltransferase family protein, partial [Lachnospiraceae bacterium]|nr:isoprenylcysteine carboxylmethyltransferase family protein [Lachnospiraceae bacterium]
ILLGWSHMPSWVRIAGVLAGFTGDADFLAAVLTMRDSWRAGIPETDRTEFVSHGIYRYSRNPAFLGFDLMYVGILLMYFNGILLLFTIWVIAMLHLQILQEEKYLETVFGEAYRTYRKCTGRYFGRKV